MRSSAIACLLLLAGCGHAPRTSFTQPATAPTPPQAAPKPCSAKPGPIGRVEATELNEISGVVESRLDPRVLFVHNDSGDSPRFFAIDRSGVVLAELRLETVPLLLDAEDMAIGPGPSRGQSYLYLGDTGNNFASMGLGIPRRKAVLYRIPEPAIALTARHLVGPVSEAFPIVLTFPRGARDVEAFFIDPRSGDLFIITKQPDGHSQLLRGSALQLAGGGGELSYVAELWFGRPPLNGSPMPTSASISRDGSAILVRTYSSVFLFERRSDEAVPSALARAPRELPSPREKQGEAIGFVDGDRAFITISEGVRPLINCAQIEATP